MDQSELITMTKAELEQMQKDCAAEGAKMALASLGLDDKQALEDIKDLRDLLTAFRTARTIVWQTVVKYITVFTLGALALGFVQKVTHGGQ